MGKPKHKNSRKLVRQMDHTQIPYAENPMNILGKFDAEIEGNQRAVRSTVYVTGEGRGNFLGYETAGEINKVDETAPVKTTDRYSKLCEEYNDIFEDIGKTIQPGQNQHQRIPYHIREKVQEVFEKLEQLDIIEEWWTPRPRFSSVRQGHGILRP